MHIRKLKPALALAVVATVFGSGVGVSAAGARSTAGGRVAADPGITKTEIRVGGVASVTNPLNGPYDSTFDGVQAYFNMVNAKGGVNGRKFKLVARRDDKIASNAQEVQGLLEQDKVFAALPLATIFSFAGAKALAEAKVPSFGWGINKEWAGPPNLYSFGGQRCFDCVTTSYPMVVKLTGRKKLGVLAYGVANSSECADQQKAAFEKYPTAEIVYMNTSLSFGQVDFSAEVKAMKDAGVTLITHCVDQNAGLALGKEMKKQSLKAVQVTPNAYDHEFMKVNAQFFEGALVRLAFAPFETKPAPKGLTLFKTWMAKGKYALNEMSMVGWLDAHAFVEGVRMAGKNPTRASVIKALNAPSFRNNTFMGLLPGSETINHTTKQKLDCIAIVQIQKDGSFKNWKSKPGKPFLCWDSSPATTPTVTLHK